MYTRAAAEHGRVLDHYDDHGHRLPGDRRRRRGDDGRGRDQLRRSTTRSRSRGSSGDETVPAFSAAMDTPRDRLHYVCGISHVPLTTDPQTTQPDGRVPDPRRADARRAGATATGSARELSGLPPGPDLAAGLGLAGGQGHAVRRRGRQVVRRWRTPSRPSSSRSCTFGASTKIVATGGSRRARRTARGRHGDAARPGPEGREHRARASPSPARRRSTSAARARSRAAASRSSRRRRTRRHRSRAAPSSMRPAARSA